ncbi:uncharacterized protein CANTADRAFT_29890, partial [Suhomyces tanzawaensis NRRL Y-17324]
DSTMSTSSEIVSLTLDLLQHHKDGNTYLVLALMPNFRISSLPLIHFVFGLTLFKLGRIGGALREVSLSIELEDDLEEREKYIRHLMKFFKKLGMLDEAVSCFGEIIEMKQQLGRIDEAQRESFNKLVECKEEIPPLHIQAENYSQSVELPSPSLSSKCIQIHKYIQTSIQCLQESKTTSEVLNPIFHAIILMGPNYLFGDLLYHEAILYAFLENDLLSFPEIDYRMGPKTLLSQLKTWSYKSITSPKSILLICETFVKHKTIRGYINYFKKNYELAIEDFQWVNRFVAGVKAKLRLAAGNIFLSKSTERVALMYTCLSYIQVPSSNEVQLQSTLSRMSYLDYSFPQEFLSGRLGNFFLCCGKVYERLSYTRGSWIKIENENSMQANFAFKYDSDAIIEMVRKYILVTTSSLPDDPIVLQAYDRILWGILLHGGLHLNCLWFFITLKNYFLLELDYGPLQVTKEHDIRLFDDEDVLGKYENGWELIFQAWELEKEMLYLEKKQATLHSLWEYPRTNKFLLPKIFEYESTLLMVEATFDGGTDESFARCLKYLVKPMLKTCLNKIKGANVFEENTEKSKDFVRLWFASYRDIYGVWPDIV